jgi:hypothetical protein
MEEEEEEEEEEEDDNEEEEEEEDRIRDGPQVVKRRNWSKNHGQMSVCTKCQGICQNIPIGKSWYC